MLASCAPVNNILITNNIELNKVSEKQLFEKKIKLKKTTYSKKILTDKKKIMFSSDIELQKEITIIFSKKDNPAIVKQFINVIELAVYKKKLQDISFKIKIYENPNDLKNFIEKQNLDGKIFIGPLNSKDTSLLSPYCNNGAIFFSFSSNKNLAKNCVYLINFFPENEMRVIFNHLDSSKVALMYPENVYGFGINEIIDDIANQSNSVIVNRASYKENLSNAAEAIKELGKYELRKYELNRQKKILRNKKDDKSKKRLAKLERFQTTQDFDFTHVIIADYGLRLLQVAPLLAYYDIDPNVVRFVGTGAWDDEIFYDEPSLNGSIYPGIEFSKRRQLVEDYYELYNEKLLRTSTLPFDLVGLLAFAMKNKSTLFSLYELLDESNTKFSGTDGGFYFINNVIERDLSILKIDKGKALSVVSK